MKNVLIITYYWPPSGGGGVQRWLKFTKYLPDEGWHCLVCTPENPDFDQKDQSLEAEVHPDTEVLKLPIWEPYNLYKKFKGQATMDQGVTPGRTGGLSRFIRGNFMIPDPRRFWVRPATRFLKQFLRDRKVDVIVTTGPPHSMHLIGKKLHRKTGIPWVADFRDPWSRWDMLDEFGLTAWARNIHKKMERNVFREATGTITVSKEWAEDFERDHGILPEVITNGFDADDFAMEHSTAPSEFRIVHTGLLNNFRNIPVLWKILAEMFESGELKGEVILRGMVDDEIKASVKSALGDLVSVGPSIPHRQVTTLLPEASVLLLFMNRSENAAGHIPGKLFEYLAARRWILAFGDPSGAAAGIIKETNSGVVVSWDDEVGIREALQQYYSYCLSGKVPDSPNTERYTRRRLTSKLSAYLNSILG